MPPIGKAMARISKEGVYRWPFREWRWPALILMILLPLVYAITDACHDNLSEERYVVKLFDPYFIQRLSYRDPNSKRLGPYQLILIDSPNSAYLRDENPPPVDSFMGPFANPLFVPQVERVATVGHIIVGKTTSAYFIVDARNHGAIPRFYGTREQVNTELKTDDIAPSRFMDPNEIASALPPPTIRPWAYENMDALWGRSDIWWEGLIVESGYLVAIVVGSLMPWGKSAKGRRMSIAAGILFVVVLACWVNFKANDQILGSGPDSFVGQFVLPPTYVIAALWGMGIRRLILDSSRGKPPISGHGQTPG